MSKRGGLPRNHPKTVLWNWNSRQGGPLNQVERFGGGARKGEKTL